MLDDETPADETTASTDHKPHSGTDDPAAPAGPSRAGTTTVTRRRRAAGRPAGPPVATFSAAPTSSVSQTAPAAATASSASAAPPAQAPSGAPDQATPAADSAGARSTAADPDGKEPDKSESTEDELDEVATSGRGSAVSVPVFQAPDAALARPRRRAASRPAGQPAPTPASKPDGDAPAPNTPAASSGDSADDTRASTRSRASGTRRARGTRRTGGTQAGTDTVAESADTSTQPAGTAAPVPAADTDAAAGADGATATEGGTATGTGTATDGATATDAGTATDGVTGTATDADTSTDTSTDTGTDTSTDTGTDAGTDTGTDGAVTVITPDADPSDDGADTITGGTTETTDGTEAGEGGSRRRRRRGGRRRRKSGGDTAGDDPGTSEASESGQGAETSPGDPSAESAPGEGTSTSSRRRRRRRRRGEEPIAAEDDPANTTVRVRERKAAEDEITSVHGSTRLEAKKQRRREGRDAGRRRAPIVSEAEFLARRESVEREMVVRRRADLTQIAVLEDDVLVEHYVARGSQTSMIGNVYLGRVQNVLPSMEAAFVDIGKGRNAVLYAGEVDWKAFDGEGKPRRIEEVLSSGQSVLVQVTKDPVGHKGARLTSQVSLPGRFLVYVPAGHTSGISRKLPDTERNRLKALLKEIVPSEAGVIVRTAAEGATEEQLTRDVAALTAQWDDITGKATGQGPKLLYAEPDLMIKVVRDLYNEDFKGLTVQGDEAWSDVQAYVEHVAPDLGERLKRWDDERDVFAAYRLDEQIAKGTDRKVWLPSGGSLVIDRTEAMTVVDVNTGKFTGSGGNLEETVTKNNLEAAEEIVRQLRLRDIGGIIVIDFIDMVLEDNRDLVLRRLVECLGRDRTRHQVAEVTSLGLVQLTRKRIGTGLLEAFSEPCTCCQGRGLHVLTEPVAPDSGASDDGEPRGRGGEGSGRSRDRSRDRGRQAQASPGGSNSIPKELRPRPRPPEPKGVQPELGAPLVDDALTERVTAAADSAPVSHAVEPGPDPAGTVATQPDVVASAAESSVPLPEDEVAPPVAEPSPAAEPVASAPAPTPDAAQAPTPASTGPDPTPATKPKRARRAPRAKTAAAAAAESPAAAAGREPATPAEPPPAQ